jgi:signal transduction histidine kinase
VLDNALRGEETSNFELPRVAKDGRRITVLLNATTRRNVNRHIVGVIGVGQDITEAVVYRETLEQRVEERTRELDEALQAEREVGQLKSRFASMASHEFRTPLAAIQATADIMDRYRDRMDEDQRTARLDKIRSEVRHMTRLLDDVLTIGRAEAGKTEFRPTACNPEEFCRALVEEHDITSGASHDIRLAYDGPTGAVLVDEKLMRNALSNLLQNALKYSDPGTVVDFDVSCEDGTTVIRVRDRGIGVPPDDIKRLFEPFHRATNVGALSGTGLGPAIVRESAKVHGGHIEVVSEVGEGSTFTLRVRLEPVV